MMQSSSYSDFYKEIIPVLTAFKNGDFNRRMPPDFSGAEGKVADLLNDIIDQSSHFAEEYDRIGETAGRQGKLESRLELPHMRGAWKGIVGNSNEQIGRAHV